MSNTGNSIEWAIRVCESIAFSIHSVIGLTEPCSGIMKHVTENSLICPNIFFPLGGIFLAIVAYLNFSENDYVVLGAQFYVAAFHTGAVFTHLRVEHHPAAAAAPGIFILLAFIVVGLRTDILAAFLGITLSISVGVMLGFVFVRPKREHSIPLLEDSEG
jgi:hypothetical protein